MLVSRISPVLVIISVKASSQEPRHVRTLFRPVKGFKWARCNRSKHFPPKKKNTWVEKRTFLNERAGIAYIDLERNVFSLNKGPFKLAPGQTRR